ncbi:MAG: hypothetical protein JW885_16280 [Deltaproteobacteria bacterium]|nr:hypothetical protein [Candidatus Zymogenaceae bacterium]
MDFHKKTKKMIVYGLFVAASAYFLFIFILSRFEFSRSILFQQYQYGDLYEMALVRDFRFPRSSIPTHYSDVVLDDIDEADIICFGDSFFVVHGDLFARMLKEKTGKKVASVNPLDVVEESNNPIVMLTEFGYEPQEHPTIMIWERVERGITPLFVDPKIERDEIFDKIEAAKTETISTSDIREDLTFVYTKNISTVFVQSLIKTGKFRVFGEISPLTPEYSLEPEMLFYYRAVEGYKRKMTESFIQKTADNIALTSERVKETFGITTVFMACPNKYTVYGDFAAAPDYNELIPLLVEALEERGVITVDLTKTYDDYRKEHGDTSFLYYQSDTHWNELGTRIAVDEIVRVLEAVEE